MDSNGSDINGEAANDHSGSSISLSSDGKILVVGAYTNDGNGSTSGHARIYKWSNNSWSQIGSDIDGEAQGDQFGISTSISSNGNRIAVGGYFNMDLVI